MEWGGGGAVGPRGAFSKPRFSAPTDADLPLHSTADSVMLLQRQTSSTHLHCSCADVLPVVDLHQVFTSWHSTDAWVLRRASHQERVCVQVKPTHVLNAAGLTGRPNVDWCEDHKVGDPAICQCCPHPSRSPLVVAQALSPHRPLQGLGPRGNEWAWH